MPASEAFNQLALRFTDPVQYSYEVIRGIMLADETITARSEATGLDRATIGEKAQRFLEEGMLGLVDRRTITQAGRHQYPELVAACILYLKQLYPRIHYCEIVRIVGRKFGCKTNHHTVKRFLEDNPIPVQLPLPITTFHQFEDAYRARWTVVRMYHEGWHQKSIAGCLKISRPHVMHILQAFASGDFAGLEDQRTRPANHPDNQLTLPLLKEVLEIQQEYPRAGRFRVRGLLALRTGNELPSDSTITRAMAINRRHHGAPGPWVTDKPPIIDDVVKYLPYEPAYRHQYWFIDIRYIKRIDEDQHWTYSISVIEGYSREFLAGMASEYQDTVAVIQLLKAALVEYGKPEAIVSDNSKVFTSEAYTSLLEELNIEICYIEKGKPWENLIEAQFKIQLRLADAHFEQAQSFVEIQERHAQFVQTFNNTHHYAHRQRSDKLRTPAAVLGWVRGRKVTPEELQRALRHLQVERVVTKAGYVSIQRFYIYAERGLARKRVSIWLHDGHLQIAWAQTLLAHYAYRYNRDERKVTAVDQPRLYRTAFASPQLELWELDDEQWRKVLEHQLQRRLIRNKTDTNLKQLLLPKIAAQLAS
jgi:transposase InsO family protein